MRYSWLYSIGIRDSERALRDERESGDKKDNRGEGKVKLCSFLAMEGKSSCFWSCAQSEIEPANLQNKGLRGVLALLTVKLNPLTFPLTSSPFYPCGSF